MTTPHLPHLRVPHPQGPHAGFDDHPWRMLPAALLVIVLLAAVLIAVSFTLAKALTGQAY